MRRVILETACGCRKSMFIPKPMDHIRVGMLKQSWAYANANFDVSSESLLTYRIFEFEGEVDGLDFYREKL